MEAIISLDQIGLTFHRDGQSTEVLRDFSLDVPAGRFVAVIGPSGVGKSTLLRVIAGLLPPTTGRVTIRTRRDDGRLPVAMVFQDARLLPWRKVVSNVGFGLEHGRLSAAERREKAEAALALVELTGYSGRYPKNCPAASASGWRSRVRSRSIPTSC